MRPLASLSLGVVVTLAASAAGILALRGIAGAMPPMPDAPGRYYGAASCAGSNCHSAAEPRATPPGLQEYTTWSTVDKDTGVPYDRHGYAYNRLFTDASKAIAAKLNALEGTKGEAQDSERCLTCHGVSVHDFGSGRGGTPVGTHKELQGGKYEAADGVSCDGCHGPAEKWIKAHAEKDWAPKKWKELGSEKLYDEWGIYYSKDPVLWAGQCVRCHLAIDTNQIAAGHPDLVPFELYAQSAASSPHWRDYAAAKPAPELPAAGPFHAVRLWQTGQCVALAAAARGVEARAKGERHNDAKGEAMVAGVRAAAARAWGHYAVLRHAAKRFANGAAAKNLEAKALALYTATAAQTLDLGKVATAASDLAAAAQALARAAADTQVDAAYAKGVLSDVAHDPAALEQKRCAEQVSMALYALYAGYAQHEAPTVLTENPPTDPTLVAIYDLFPHLASEAPEKDVAFKGALAKVVAAIEKIVNAPKPKSGPVEDPHAPKEKPGEGPKK